MTLLLTLDEIADIGASISVSVSSFAMRLSCAMPSFVFVSVGPVVLAFSILEGVKEKALEST